MKNKLALITIIFSFMAGNTANAALIQTDLVSGDNNLVYDDVNNLEWLRWDLTSKNSLNNLLVTYDQFHLASESELRSLYDQAWTSWAFDLSVTTASPGSQNYTDAANFQNLFGYGNLQGGLDPVTYGGLMLDSGAWRMYGLRYNTNSDNYHLFNNNPYTGTGEAHNETSYILVRDAITSVPEPTSIALLGLGLVGLSFSRKKKSA